LNYTVTRESILVVTLRAIYTYSCGILLVSCRDFKRSRSPCLHIAHSECRRLPSVMVLPAISDRPAASTSPWNSEPFCQQSGEFNHEHMRVIASGSRPRESSRLVPSSIINHCKSYCSVSCIARERGHSARSRSLIDSLINSLKARKRAFVPYSFTNSRFYFCFRVRLKF